MLLISVMSWKAITKIEKITLYTYVQFLSTLLHPDEVMAGLLVTLTLKSVDRILWVYHSSETSLLKLLRSARVHISEDFTKRN